MSNSNTARSGGISFLGALCLIFITLKLTHTIAWSWVFVLAPLWAPLALLIAGLTLFFTAASIVYLIRLPFNGILERRRIAKKLARRERAMNRISGL